MQISHCGGCQELVSTRVVWEVELWQTHSTKPAEVNLCLIDGCLRRQLTLAADVAWLRCNGAIMIDKFGFGTETGELWKLARNPPSSAAAADKHPSMAATTTKKKELRRHPSYFHDDGMSSTSFICYKWKKKFHSALSLPALTRFLPFVEVSSYHWCRQGEGCLSTRQTILVCLDQLV